MDENKYLWDKSGPADPEVERLERLLTPLRHNRPVPNILPASGRPTFGGLRTLVLLAAAAAVLVAAGAVWLARGPQGGWMVVRLEGSPRVGSEWIGETGRLSVGEWIETDSSSSAKLQIGRIGQVEVAPNSRLRLVAARWADHRLALAHGTIEARIWAPPRLFFVETPSARAVDLGCVYTLEVDRAGAGRLSVTAGWVQLERDGRESLVPAGASCATRPGIGPGTPFYDDASPAFEKALEAFDFANGGKSALDVVLAEARKRDALTLWHLLLRTQGAEQNRVYDRLSSLVPPPTGVTREAITRREDKALELWRDQLDLPWFQKDVPWWRKTWHRVWS